jgi:hypothetical protein
MKSNHLKFLLAALAGVLSINASAQHSDEELAKQLANPVASLISVPFQSNWDFNMGPLDEGTQYKLNFQPVIPFSLGQDWNLITRTIVPYISQEDVFKGPLPKFPGVPDEVLALYPRAFHHDIERAAEKVFNKAVKKAYPVDHHQDGLSDILQSFFLSPKEPVGGWILGFGPALLYPTATDDKLGTEKWAAGPTAVVLKQQGGWTYGVLTNHLWSYAGNDERRNVNQTFVQPFLTYITKTKTTFALNSESTYDWNNSQWLVPVNLQVSQLVRFGKLPVQFQVGGRYYAEGPSGAPEWGLRFTITPLFPTSHEPSAPANDKGFVK